MPARYGLNGITNPVLFLYPSRDFCNACPSARSGAARRVQAPGIGPPKTCNKGETPRPRHRGVSVLRAPTRHHNEKGEPCVQHST